MKLFGMCIDKRVVIGVVATAGLVWWAAPGAFVAALPWLLFAICPLSMLFMMNAMNQQPDQTPPTLPTLPTSPATEEPTPSPTADARAVVAAAADVDSRRN